MKILIHPYWIPTLEVSFKTVSKLFSSVITARTLLMPSVYLSEISRQHFRSSFFFHPLLSVLVVDLFFTVSNSGEQVFVMNFCCGYSKTTCGFSYANSWLILITADSTKLPEYVQNFHVFAEVFAADVSEAVSNSIFLVI